MIPRERVLQAVAHQPTDRAPANYGAHRGVTDRLIAKLGVNNDEELLCALGVDLRAVSFNYYQPPAAPDADGYERDMWGGRKLVGEPKDGKPAYLSPFTEESTVDDVHAHSWPDPRRLDCRHVRAECEKHHGTYAVFGGPWCPFFHEMGWLLGQEEYFIWMATKPEVVEAITHHMVEYELAATRAFLDATRGVMDILYIGNDFGTQRGLFISPASWHQFVRPYLKRFYDLAHDYGCKVMQHSCGGIRQVIPALMEDGVDILDPIQTACDGMNLPRLVQDFGRQLCFHGGVDTQYTLPQGSIADVRAEVRSYLDATRQRGGYILCGSQLFIEDIPLDNIVTMYEENRKDK